MSKKHKRLLHQILFEPPGANVQWKDLEALLLHLGADIEAGHGARFKLSLNGQETSIHRPHQANSCNKRDIHLLRDFLVAADIGAASLD